VKKWGLAVAPAIVIIVGLWFVPTAPARGIVYWANYGSSTLSYASLGSGTDGQLRTGAANLVYPLGEALDPATGQIYWANDQGGTGTGSIAWAKPNYNDLGGNLTITGGSMDYPWGFALDPAAGKMYWANEENNTITYANLDGSSAANLNTAGATVAYPTGITVDPALGKVFWTNDDSNVISWAHLNGSGGGTLDTGAATVDHASGLAIDPVNKRIYWANYGDDSGTTIGWAKLNGTGGGNLDTSGATVEDPIGVAVDPAAGRVYWANFDDTGFGGPISSASVNGGDGSNLSTPGAGGDGEVFPVLLYPPSGIHRPKLTGGKKPGSKLKCTQGRWASDTVEAFFYQSPQSYSYSWKRNRHKIRGAKKSSYKAHKAGRYTCTVTATNAAGSTRQTTKTHKVK
jgi:DNA-binding beta-propeller fold protein YncE